MEDLEGSTPYLYDELPKTPILAYRIFILDPASKYLDPIKGRLETSHIQPLSEAIPSIPAFEALSYAWGDDTPTSKIHVRDKWYLPIAASLESFLRSRRQPEQPIALWIDAICIDQNNLEEKNVQVPAMNMIYAISCCTTVWLGPSSEDSALAVNTLRTIANGTAFSKLCITLEESLAIDRILQRAWFYRTWIIQEIAFAFGTKYSETIVRCGPDSITWMKLVQACARMHLNASNMRQRFPAVEKVLKLDVLASRGKDDVLDADGSETYPDRLLQQLGEYRYSLASNPRDKIYSLLGLHPTAVIEKSYIPPPPVDYMRSPEEVYTEFAKWFISTTQSLDVLHHCQLSAVQVSQMDASLPSWVPNWSQMPAAARLLSAVNVRKAKIPWWSLPEPNEGGGIRYLMDGQIARRKRAKELLLPRLSSRNQFPEWFVDALDPDGTKGTESMIKELLSRPDFLVVGTDKCDRAVGNVESPEIMVSRIMDHNEQVMQKGLLSRYFQDRSLLRVPYKASGDTPCRAVFDGNHLHVTGVLCDTIQELYEVFPDEVTETWINSTKLMVQIGKSKQSFLEKMFEKSPYDEEQARLIAFWKTLFVGQGMHDEKEMAMWLPNIPPNWNWQKPSLTVLESARLEYAERGSLIAEFTKHLPDTNAVGSGIFESSGMDENLAKDDLLVDSRWTSSERLHYQHSFEALGKWWDTQPYDLYHRPFKLPYVVPDPYWNSRCIHDKIARKVSFDARYGEMIASIESDDRDIRRNARKFMTDRIRQQPARDPQNLGEMRLINYALGRRLIVSKDGYLGLAPPEAKEGDHIVVLHGMSVPFILRKKGAKYQVVGESYVHGLMNGEAIDMWHLGMREVRNIVLA